MDVKLSDGQLLEALCAWAYRNGESADRFRSLLSEQALAMLQSAYRVFAEGGGDQVAGVTREGAVLHPTIRDELERAARECDPLFHLARFV